MTRVLAQGTFDILHPGHIHYLREAASLGEQLHVIIARRENVTHKPAPVVPGAQRRELVAALEMVDHAHLGAEDDIFQLVEDIDPDLLVLGHDQHHDPAKLETEFRRREIDCRIKRATKREANQEELLSTGRIIERILTQRGENYNSS